MKCFSDQRIVLEILWGNLQILMHFLWAACKPRTHSLSLKLPSQVIITRCLQSRRCWFVCSCPFPALSHIEGIIFLECGILVWIIPVITDVPIKAEMPSFFNLLCSTGWNHDILCTPTIIHTDCNDQEQYMGSWILWNPDFIFCCGFVFHFIC